jgi:sporulation protein YabP
MTDTHRLILEQRSKLTATGVTEVLRFDEEAVILRSGEEVLQILGQGLKLKQLAPDGGNVTIEGSIQALSYEQARPTGSWMRRFVG